MNFDKKTSPTNFSTIFTGTLENEDNIITELGIDLKNVLEGSKLIFNIFDDPNSDFLENPDIIGPLVILGIYSLILILNGKTHFEYIYFLTLFSVFLIYFLYNVIGDIKNISLFQVFSGMFYSFGPIILYGVINRLIPKKFKIFFSVCCSLWSAFTASNVLSHFTDMKYKNLLFMYPMTILYFTFCCLIIF